MTSASEILTDSFSRIRDAVHDAVQDLGDAELATRPDHDANSIAWLAWHLTRVMDDHIADAAGQEQVWTADGWAERLDLPFADDATGYGHGTQEVGAVRVPANDVLGYFDAVVEQTLAYLDSLDDDDLDRVVDENWDPPVTLAVRLVSVLSDGLQHAGQAAYVRGLIGGGANSPDLTG